MVIFEKKLVKKFLIIRLSSIGDIVLTTPVIRCMKEQVSDAEIHFITRKQYAAVVQSNPHIDKLHLVDDNLSEVLSALKTEKFDAIIDLHKNLRSRKIISFLGVKSYSFNKVNIRKWLLVNLKIDRLPKVHIVDRYFGAVDNFGVVNDGKGLDFFSSEQNRIELNDLPDPQKNGYLAWVIGGNHKTKLFPKEKIINIIRMVQKPIVLIGGPDDKEAGEDISRTFPDLVYNACGKFGIAQSASLIQRADLVLTNDTGMMHIAAAFNKKIISFWGNTVPEFGMTPYMPGKSENSKIIEVKDLSCRPCSKLGFSKCPKKHFFCMNKIDDDSICRLINEVRGENKNLTNNS